MKLEQIKTLTISDFESDKNEEIWESIENLTFDEINSLRGVWDNSQIEWDLFDILSVMATNTLKQEVIDKLTPDQKRLFRDFICFDKYIMWDNFRSWDLVG